MFASRAKHAKQIQNRLFVVFKRIAAIEAISEHIGVAQEVYLEYAELQNSIDEFVKQQYNDWVLTLKRQDVARLNRPLIIKSEIHSGYMQVNFDEKIARILSTIDSFKRLGFSVPGVSYGFYNCALKKKEISIL